MAAIYNILKHDMVPGHFLLTDEETEKVLKDLNITKDQLPKIKENDAAIEVLKDIYGRDKVTEGSVIKIIRKSETMEDFVVYRLVTKRLSE